MDSSVKGTVYKLPLVLEAQPEGGYTVTCPLLPELITEGDSVREALVNAEDALAAVLEGLKDLGRPMPSFLQPVAPGAPIWLKWRSRREVSRGRAEAACFGLPRDRQARRGLASQVA